MINQKITLSKNKISFKKSRKRSVKGDMSLYMKLSFKNKEHEKILYEFSKISEDNLQAMVVKYVREEIPEALIFSIPNGSHKGYQSRVLFKNTGLLAGVSDLFLCNSNKLYHGLFIELKKGKNSQSSSQIEFQKKAQARGYNYVVKNDLLKCINQIKFYLKTV